MSSQITGQGEFLLAQFAGMWFVACKIKIQTINPQFLKPGLSRSFVFMTIFDGKLISFSNSILRKPVRPPVFVLCFVSSLSLCSFRVTDVTVASKITIIM
jgi:hypothetical protein